MPIAFVTGANGFIGSHLVRELLKRGYEVRCLVRHTSDLSALRGLKLALYVGDVRESATLITPLKNVNYVFHLAAELMVTSREEFEQTNTRGTINLLEATEKVASQTIERFLFVSSQAAAGPAPDPTPIDEDSPLKPISWYGTSKQKAEDAVHGYAERLPVTIVRPAAVYGPREREFSQTYGFVEKRLQPQIGLQSKKYVVMVYVGDLVNGIIEAAESNNTLNQTYFLNHPDILTSKDTVQTIAKAMNKSSGLLIPVPLFLISLMAPIAELVYHFTRNRPQLTRDKARELSQRFWVANPSKAKQDFGWEASFPLLEGMMQTIPVYREEQRELREMPLEKGMIFYIKYILIAVIIGIVVETVAYIGGYYRFDPSWGAIVIAVGVIGIGFGILSMMLRKSSDAIQFVVGTIIAGAIELLNYLDLLPLISWKFAQGWPFGITNPWLRIFVLAFPGGVIILLLNTIMRSLYKRRLRLG